MRVINFFNNSLFLDCILFNEKQNHHVTFAGDEKGERNKNMHTDYYDIGHSNYTAVRRPSGVGDS